MKSTRTLIALVGLVLLLGGVGYYMATRGGSDEATVTSGSARGTAPIARGSASAPAVARAPAAVVDPLPGQGRATTEPVAAEGGVMGGRVINWSTGAGVSGAELTFSGTGGATTIRSKGDGSFELAPPAPGTFELTAVVAAGFLPYAPELAHSTVGATLAAGHAVRGITVFLFPAVDYRGRVVDATGAAVAGARVRLLGTPSGEQTIEKLATEWTTDAAGAFTFHAADDAVFEAVRGKARGWARLDGDVAITKLLTITIGDAPPRDATIRGTTVDETGAPLADVLVSAEPEDPAGKAEVPRATAFATSGPDGAFVLEGLDRMTYQLAAETEGRARVVAGGIAGGTSGVKLTIAVGLPIAGVVVTGDGAPVPAYTLLVLVREGAVRHTIAARSIIEPTGKFRVLVPAGDYDLVAAASGLAPSTPTQVSAGTTNARLVVSAGATLRGTVVASDGTGPLRYARVMREASGGGASTNPANAGTVTRDDGTFELTGIPPGPVSITIAAGGFHPRIESGMTAVEGGELGPLTVPLTRLREGEKPSLELVGIGVKLAADGDTLRVEMVWPDSGAAAAGIVPADHLVAVDGVPVTTLGVDGAVSRIRGRVGTTVTISLRRGSTVVELVVERKKLRT